MKWIKASERLPDKHGWYPYREKSGGPAYWYGSALMVSYGFQDMPNTHAFEWLDESTDQDKEMIEFAEWIIDSYYPTSKTTWSRSVGEKTSITTSELLQLFKDQP